MSVTTRGATQDADGGEDVLASRAWADALIGAIEWAKEEGRRQRGLAEAGATETDGSIEGDAA